MRTWGILATCLLLAPLTLSLAANDPWKLPEANGVALMVVITQSEKSYRIVLDDEFPDDVKSPEHVKIVHQGRDDRSIAKCREYLEKGNAEKSAKIAAAVMRRSKGDHDASMLRAKSLLALKKPEEALPFLRQSLIGNRRNPEAWKLLEELAEKLGKKVVRPRLEPQGWIRPPDKNGEVDIGYVDIEEEGDFPWNFYAVARAVYRHEGRFRRDFRDLEEYRFTFREQLFALAVTIRSAKEKGGKVTEGLKRLLEQEEKGSLVPFVFFAMYPEPIPAEPEKHFDKLLPILEEYFDAHILIDP